MIAKVRKIIEEDDTRLGRLFNLIIQGLILLSTITFTLETLPNLSDSHKYILVKTELIFAIIFSIEYTLRIITAKEKFKFIFSFFGLIDLLSILPFYLSIGIDLRTLRTLRFLRIFRILKMGRYNKALMHFKRAFFSVKEELIIFSVVTFILMYLSAVGMYYFERDAQPEVFKSIIHSMWWSVITLTTVGYGDVYPITVGGKFFTFFILIIGMAIVAIPAGLFASALSKTTSNSKE